MLCYVVLCYINSRILLNDSWPCPTIKIQPLTMAHLLSKLRPRPGHPLRKPPSPGWYDKPLGHINRSFPNFLLILLDTAWFCSLATDFLHSSEFLSLHSSEFLSAPIHEYCLWSHDVSSQMHLWQDKFQLHCYQIVITCQRNFFPPNHLRRRNVKCSEVPGLRRVHRPCKRGS